MAAPINHAKAGGKPKGVPNKDTLNELEEEKRKLYVSKENPTRLKEIIKKLNYFYFGIK
jgi:hypothetical protein